MKKEGVEEYFTIGKLAKYCGVKTDTIRFYERLRLLTPKRRTASGYRVYSKDSEREIRFIKNAQQLGFSLEEIARLLRLNASDKKTAEDVLDITKNKISQLKMNINELQRMKKVLETLAKKCGGKHILASECPILDHFYPVKGGK